MATPADFLSTLVAVDFPVMTVLVLILVSLELGSVVWLLSLPLIFVFALDARWQ